MIMDAVTQGQSLSWWYSVMFELFNDIATGIVLYLDHSSNITRRRENSLKIGRVFATRDIITKEGDVWPSSLDIRPDIL
jgi:hypothetical protein